MSPFEKRVQLLEKWNKNRKAHTLDEYGIADLILDVWQVAEADTEERIIKLLEEYADGDLLFAEDLNTPSEEVAYTIFKGDAIELIKGEAE